MEAGSTATMATKIMGFLNDIILPGGTKLFEWVTQTDGINYFFYMTIIAGMIGLFSRIKNSVR